MGLLFFGVRRGLLVEEKNRVVHNKWNGMIDVMTVGLSFVSLEEDFQHTHGLVRDIYLVPLDSVYFTGKRGWKLDCKWICFSAHRRVWTPGSSFIRIET